jgi:hypothetical protein
VPSGGQEGMGGRHTVLPWALDSSQGHGVSRILVQRVQMPGTVECTPCPGPQKKGGQQPTPTNKPTPTSTWNYRWQSYRDRPEGYVPNWKQLVSSTMRCSPRGSDTCGASELILPGKHHAFLRSQQLERKQTIAALRARSGFWRVRAARSRKNDAGELECRPSGRGNRADPWHVAPIAHSIVSVSGRRAGYGSGATAVVSRASRISALTRGCALYSSPSSKGTEGLSPGRAMSWRHPLTGRARW